MKPNLSIGVVCFSLALLFVHEAEAQQEKGVPSAAMIRSRGEDRLLQVIISGTVVQENGTPPVGASIELDCRGSVTKEGTVDSDGNFWFRLGESNRFGQQYHDLSQDLADPFGRDSGMSPFDVGLPSSTTTRVQKMPTGSLAGCTLRAALSGYKSSAIEMGTEPLSMHIHVGTIVLVPIEKVQGATVSTTSLLAPKSAKKAMEKAKAAFRKERSSDAEKYLKSAIALYPKYGEAWFQLGRLYQAQRRIKEAREAYAKAIEIDNLYISPYVWLGLISVAEQKWQEAADLTGRALALDPTAFPEAYYLNALACFNLKNLVAAEKSAHQAELMDSAHRFPKLHLILASIDAGRDDFVDAIDQLRKYLKYGPRGDLALQKYGRAPYLGSEWETAGESLKKEMASSAGPEVRLMLAEGFWRAGMIEQAKAELTAYVGGGDITKMPPQVRDLLEQIQARKKNETISTVSKEEAGAPREKAIDYLHYPLQDLPDFEAAGDQAPMDGVLAAVGNNVSRLFAELFNISARESLQLEKFDQTGKADPGRSFEYLYLCLGAIEKQEPLFDEFRSDAQGQELRQSGLDEGYMLTVGFISAPVLFHPIHQSGSSFRLLGYQKLRGRNTIVLAFAQLPGRTRLQGNFQVGKKIQETFKQGIVWIDAEDYQIIRLVSDLLQPLPQVGLEKLRTEIDFDGIRFDQISEEFWLPVQVVVTINWNGRVLRNTHAYSDFKLFDVQTSQRIAKPKSSGEAIEQPPLPPEK